MKKDDREMPSGIRHSACLKLQTGTKRYTFTNNKPCPDDAYPPTLELAPIHAL
ncbi:hypothetical protein C8C95_1108 [Acidovorax sp. 99]|nr:hypothetical protein C8C95_1108 [Acidovorax sp. 99]